MGIENADELKSLAMASAIDATSKASVQLAMDVIENGATACAQSKARGFTPLALTKTIQSAPVPMHDVGSNVATRFTRWRWLSGSPPKAGVLTDFIEIFATLFQVSEDHFEQRWENRGDEEMASTEHVVNLSRANCSHAVLIAGATTMNAAVLSLIENDTWNLDGLVVYASTMK